MASGVLSASHAPYKLDTAKPGYRHSTASLATLSVRNKPIFLMCTLVPYSISPKNKARETASRPSNQIAHPAIRGRYVPRVRGQGQGVRNRARHQTTT